MHSGGPQVIITDARAHKEVAHFSNFGVLLCPDYNKAAGNKKMRTWLLKIDLRRKRAELLLLIKMSSLGVDNKGKKKDIEYNDGHKVMQEKPCDSRLLHAFTCLYFWWASLWGVVINGKVLREVTNPIRPFFPVDLAGKSLLLCILEHCWSSQIIRTTHGAYPPPSSLALPDTSNSSPILICCVSRDMCSHRGLGLCRGGKKKRRKKSWECVSVGVKREKCSGCTLVGFCFVFYHVK